MKVYLLNLIFLLFTITLFAQRPAQSYGSISKKIVEGKVIDSETNQALEYATITFTNKRNSNLLQGGITDSAGNFKVDIFPGLYDISIDFIGFESYLQEAVMIRESINLGEIKLNILVDRLEGVELMAERTEVEIRLDKRIYNV